MEHNLKKKKLFHNAAFIHVHHLWEMKPKHGDCGDEESGRRWRKRSES
jgi:hypothetical protein